MSALIKNKVRYFILFITAIICIVAVDIEDIKVYVQTFEETLSTPATVFVDAELKSDFKEIADYKLDFWYELSFSNDYKNSDIILTSYIDKINKSKDYEVVAYSPLIIAMNNTEELNNYLISKNEKGFLISEEGIKNKSSDQINCDFKKIVEAIIANQNWTSLGGSENKEIKIYCPSLQTRDGELFKEFLIRIYNNGSKTSNEEINEKIQKFFNSPNVIQTDISEKLELLNYNLSSNEIFIGFEYEFIDCLGVYNASDESSDGISFIYPNTTILKQIYAQCNKEDEKLKERVLANSTWSDAKGMYNHFFYNKHYRTSEKPDKLYYSSTDYNVQVGISTFENY